MALLTHVQKLQLQNGQGVTLIKAHDVQGKAFYAVVELNRREIEMLSRQYESGEAVNLEAYGMIVKKGWGHEPSQEVLNWLKQEYGLDISELSENAEG